MRVLHVSHGWDEGGSALYAAAVADEQRRQGHDVHRFGPANVSGARERGFASSFRSEAVESAFQAQLAGVDAVHVHHLSGLSMHVPLLARAAGARVFVTLHDYWLICARGQLVNEHGKRCVGPEVARCASCLAEHLWAPVPAAIARRLPRRSGPVYARTSAWTSLRAATHRFFAPSAHVARRLAVDADVLPLPLLRTIPPAPEPEPGPLRVLFLGSWLPTKGPDVLLDAYASLPAGAATLRMVGPAPAWNGSTAWAEALRKRAEETPGVSVAGAVAPAAVVSELHEADVFVLPSVWEENAPLVLGEALAAGLRVLASDVGGVREVAPEARFVEPGSRPALRAALVDELRRGRGRRPSVSRPSLEAHASELLRRYLTR